jgi:putative transposase
MLLMSGGAHLTLRKFERGEIVLQNVATQECKAITEGALLQAIFDGKVSLVSSEQSDPALGVELTRAQERGATTKAVRHAAHLLQWVTALRQKGVTAIRDAAWIRAEINTLAKGDLAHLPRFALSTLYEADLKLRNAQDDVGVLVPDYANRGGRGKTRIDPVAQQIMSEELKARLDEPLPRPLKILEIWQCVDKRIATHNVSADRAIAPVSESSVRRYVNREVPAFVRLELRVGKKKALKIYRSNSGARDVAARPLETSEFDDIDTGVFCIDGRNGLPWGRAWLTNGVDQNSDVPLGYDLGTKPRSYESAIGAICHSLLPKPDCLPGEMGYGVQGVMLVDNASYNAGLAMRHRCETEGLLFARARPFGSTEKTVIEYFNHRVKSDFCPTVPGWRGDKHNRDAIKKGMDSAILTVEEFAKAYRHWLTKIYANTPGDDGHTPKQRWLKFYERHSPAIRYTPQQLELLRLRPESLTFRDSGGLLRLKLRYDGPELDELRRKLGATASVVAYVPSTLTYLKVLNPFTSAYIHVPCTENHHYVTTTTETQHKLILALQRTRKKTNPSLGDLVEGRQILRQMVEEASESHKLRTRRWGIVVGVPAEAPSQAPEESVTKPVEVVCTELEYQVAQLEEVDLSDLEDWA